MATIREKGPAQWHVQIRRKGWPTQTRTFVTKRDAEAWARAVEGQMDRGHFVDRSPAERETLRDIIDRYIVEVTDKRPGEASRLSERARLERFKRVETELCAHAVAHLTYEMFEVYRDRRMTETPSRGRSGSRGQTTAPPKPLSPGSVKRELTLLKCVLDHSQKRLRLATNPLCDVEMPTVHDQRDVRLSPQEWARLLDECQRSRNPWLAPALELALETGARKGSLLKLQWDDLTLDHAAATLRGVKNSRRPSEIRTVEIGLSPRAIEILRDLPRRSLDGRVLPTTKDALDQAFKRARVRAGVPHFRWHDARHEMASTLKEAGWEMLDVMKQGDWRDPKSLARYYNARGAHLGAKLAKTKKGVAMMRRPLGPSTNGFTPVELREILADGSFKITGYAVEGPDGELLEGRYDNPLAAKIAAKQLAQGQTPVQKSTTPKKSRGYDR